MRNGKEDAKINELAYNMLDELRSNFSPQLLRVREPMKGYNTEYFTDFMDYVTSAMMSWNLPSVDDLPDINTRPVTPPLNYPDVPNTPLVRPKTTLPKRKKPKKHGKKKDDSDDGGDDGGAGGLEWDYPNPNPNTHIPTEIPHIPPVHPLHPRVPPIYPDLPDLPPPINPPNIPPNNPPNIPASPLAFKKKYNISGIDDVEYEGIYPDVNEARRYGDITDKEVRMLTHSLWVPTFFVILHLPIFGKVMYHLHFQRCYRKNTLSFC